MAFMKIRTGLSDSDRKGVVRILNALLADEYVIYTRTRKYHWNVTGPQFEQLHKFFETLYTDLNIVIDDVAERIRALGAVSPGSLAEFSKLTRLKEDQKAASAKAMLENLLDDHEALVRSLRSDLVDCGDKYHDAGTNDFLTGLMEQHEKMAWLIRAHID